ncbi:hypothetical protein GF366_00500 [Candidatus Peregrinibacteria bacterium]|nr:hypothetical protein [Candidatus Peregrinibacteria bacterium]
MPSRFLAVFGLILLFMGIWGGILAALIIIGGFQNSTALAIIIPASLILIILSFLPYLNLIMKSIFRFKGKKEKAIPLSKLKQKIKKINNLDLPVMIFEEKNRLIVTWKYVEAKWWILFAKKGLKSVYELHIKFKEKSKKATLIDVIKSVEWETGPENVKLHGGFFRGIISQIKIGKAWGIKENFKPGKIYDYKFVPAEIKTPILNEILKSGWDVRFALW